MENILAIMNKTPNLSVNMYNRGFDEGKNITYKIKTGKKKDEKFYKGKIKKLYKDKMIVRVKLKDRFEFQTITINMVMDGTFEEVNE